MDMKESPSSPPVPDVDTVPTLVDYQYLANDRFRSGRSEWLRCVAMVRFEPILTDAATSSNVVGSLDADIKTCPDGSVGPRADTDIFASFGTNMLTCQKPRNPLRTAIGSAQTE